MTTININSKKVEYFLNKYKSLIVTVLAVLAIFTLFIIFPALASLCYILIMITAAVALLQQGGFWNVLRAGSYMFAAASEAQSMVARQQNAY